MRLGKVMISLFYVVDLDDPEQVEMAKDYLCVDVEYAVRHNEIDGYIDLVEDPTLTERDICQSILESLSEDDEWDDDE